MGGLLQETSHLARRGLPLLYARYPIVRNDLAAGQRPGRAPGEGPCMRILEDVLMNYLWPRLRWSLTLAGLTLLPFLWVALAWLGPRPSPQFRSVRDLKAWAERRGLYCCSDRKDGRVTAGLALSTRPLSWEQVSGIPKEPGAHWDG